MGYDKYYNMGMGGILQDFIAFKEEEKLQEFLNRDSIADTQNSRSTVNRSAVISDQTIVQQRISDIIRSNPVAQTATATPITADTNKTEDVLFSIGNVGIKKEWALAGGATLVVLLLLGIKR